MTKENGMERLTWERIEEITASDPGSVLVFDDWHGVWKSSRGFFVPTFYTAWFVVGPVSFMFHPVDRAADGGDRYSMRVYTRYGWYLIESASVSDLLRRLQDMAVLADAAVRCVYDETETFGEVADLFRFVGACIDAISRGVCPRAVAWYESGYHVDDVAFDSGYVSSLDFAASCSWSSVWRVLADVVSSWGSSYYPMFV